MSNNPMELVSYVFPAAIISVILWIIFGIYKTGLIGKEVMGILGYGGAILVLIIIFVGLAKQRCKA